MKLIFNCDDYGFTASITRRIADAWEQGLLDGFSVIANGDALEEGAELLRARPERDARIAVHLNLFEGRSSANSTDIPLITDAAGNLKNTFVGLWLRWIVGSSRKRQALLSQIETEWRYQIVRVREVYAPRKIAALDGHLHFHMLPFLFPLALALAEEYGIGEVRVTREPFYLSSAMSDNLSFSLFANIVKNRVLNVCARRVRKSLGTSLIRHTDAFVGILYSGRMSKASAEAGIERCRRTGAQSVEVLFHIGRASETEAARWGDRRGASAFPLSPMRDREYAALKSLRAGGSV
jgi:predicted glycoside hydrolase/deacetylase ChbG (UPF0249 family)